jgi:Rrf2 family protein
LKVTAQEEYGLRCLVQVAAQPATAPITLTEIARREAMSVPHVAKLMGFLRNAGLVDSVRGRSGGYVLTRPAERISVYEALVGLGERLFDAEYCGRFHGTDDQACVHVGGCTIRSVWNRVESIVSDILRQITIADLLRMEESVLQRSLDDRSRLSTMLHLEPRR